MIRAEQAVTAPRYEWHDTAGGVHTPESLYDRVVWLDLWADFCGTCRAEFPSIQDLHVRYESAGLAVLGVCRNSSRDGFRSAAIKDWISFPMIDASRDRAFPFPYGAFPTGVLIDRSGRVRAYWQGHRPLDAIEGVVRSLLAEAPDRPAALPVAALPPVPVEPAPLRGSDSVVLARLELPRSGLAPGALLEGTIVLDLAPGWHLTAGRVEEGAVPVSVETRGGGGLAGLGVLLPAPVERTVAGTLREVYSGRVELPLWGLVRQDVAEGDQEVDVVTTVQACDAERCLVPSEIRLSGQVWITGTSP